MERNLIALGTRLFENIDQIQKMWFQIFGANFEISWNNTDKCLKDIINKTKQIMDKDGRTGHVSLLFRDPLSDRLTLEYSTVQSLNRGCRETPMPKCVPDPKKNFDSESRVCYYQLHDKLAKPHDRSSSPAREARGLTGWVAVTGHPLRINSERSQDRLEDLHLENPSLRDAVDTYGPPKWGMHVSEIPLDNKDLSSKRLLAVPIKSVHNDGITIGVLRYVCRIQDSSLTHIDLPVLTTIAQIIAAVKNLGRMKRITTRDKLLDYYDVQLKDTCNYHEFLKFLAESLGSEIASLYITHTVNGQEKLRLLDAHGIKGNIGDLREQMRVKDYSKETLGLTYELFTSDGRTPKVFESVLDTNNWRGLNTKVFYEKHLPYLESRELDMLDNEISRKEVISSYPIKLIGQKIQYNNKPIGVLKVEFPTDFDSGLHYNDVDIAFFERCVSIVAKKLNILNAFLTGEWFANDNKKHEEFVCLLSQIIVIRLVNEEDTPDFWDRVDEYLENYNDEIRAAGYLIFKDLPPISKQRLIDIFNRSKRWLPHFLADKIVDLLIALIT